MEPVKVILFKGKTLSNGKHPVMLRITINRKQRYVGLKLSCSPSPRHWNYKEGKFYEKSGVDKYKDKNDDFDKEVRRVKEIVDEFKNKKIPYTVDDVVNKYRNITTTSDKLLIYMDKIISELNKTGQAGTAAAYLQLRSVLIMFKAGKEPGRGKESKISVADLQKAQEISVTSVNKEFLENFLIYMKSIRAVKDSSISVYLRTLRSVLNRAIGDGILKDEQYPFSRRKNDRKFKIPKPGATRKRYLSKDLIKLIKNQGIDPEMQLAKDLFLFSFYTMGMAITDMALLKWDAIYDNRVHYWRKKVTQGDDVREFAIEILPVASEILDRYRGKGPYVFPIIRESDKTPALIVSRIKTVTKQVNTTLQVIAAKAGIEGKVTTYVARHSWAMAAKTSGISTAVISEGLGHTTEKTTQVYLDSFGSDVLDATNKLVTDI